MKTFLIRLYRQKTKSYVDLKLESDNFANAKLLANEMLFKMNGWTLHGIVVESKKNEYIPYNNQN